MVERNCYWCENKATSMEHVPPRCLFPEDKDVKYLFEKSFREHLITVPSCDEHNMQKSKLDEYLMVTLSGKVGNNSLAYIQTHTKIQRSTKRNSNLLDIEKGEVIKVNDKEFPVLWINVDVPKLSHSFESIARGLYYHENNKSFKGRLMIVSKLFYHPDDPDGSGFNILSSKRLESERPNWNTEVKGENKEVFSYQFSPIDGYKVQTLALNFFEGIDVYIILAELTDEEFENAKLELSPLTNGIFGE